MDDFERGITQSYPHLRSFALSLTHNATVADDLVQSTMLRALEKQGQFKPGTNLYAWLCTILKHRLFSDHRKGKTEKAYLDIKMLFSKEDIDPGQEVAMEQAEVFSEMENLPAEQREAIRLIGIEGHTYDSAAVTAGVAVGTIKSRASRGRMTLQEELQSDRKPRGARFIKRPRRNDGSVLTLYGERFALSETLKVARPGLPANTVKIFRLV